MYKLNQKREKKKKKHGYKKKIVRGKHLFKQ